MNRIGLLVITIIVVQFAVAIGVSVVMALINGNGCFYGFAPNELLKAYARMRYSVQGNDYFMPIVLLFTTGLEILAAWFFSKKVAVINKNEVFSKPHKWAADTALFGIVTFSASMIASLIVNIVKLILSGAKINVGTPDFSLPTGNPLATILMVICLVVLGPLAEEYLCRGVILNVFKRLGSVFAVVGTALIWALLHGNIIQGLPVFIMGVFYGMLALKTGSIWPTFILHAINNLFSTVITLMAATLPDNISAIAGLFNIMLMFMGITFFAVFYKRFKFNTVQGSKYGFKTFFTSVSVIISIALCLGITYLSFSPM